MNIAKFLLGLYLIIVLTVPVVALAADQEEEEDTLPSSGIIASSQSIGNQGAAVDNPYSGVDKSAVSGSVSRMGADKLKASLFNNSKEGKFAINAVVEQVNDSGRVVKKDYLNAVLNPGGTISRTFNFREGTQPRLRIASLRDLTPKKEEEQTGENNANAQQAAPTALNSQGLPKSNKARSIR